MRNPATTSTSLLIALAILLLAGAWQLPSQPLRLPQIPAELRLPSERAGWLMEHFWDNLDFTDTLAGRNQDLMEQSFVDFLSLVPHTDSASVSRAVTNLMEHAAADKTAYKFIASLAEKYLYETDSPMYDEDVYIHFLRAVTTADVLDSFEKVRPAYQLECSLKNRPGAVATDFDFTDRNGVAQSLHSLQLPEHTLLIFYDPDCDHCLEVIAGLQTDQKITAMVTSGSMAILAIFPDGEDDTDPSATFAPIPAGWMTGIDRSGIQDHELYDIREFPAIYLLDSNHRVISKGLKDSLKAL